MLHKCLVFVDEVHDVIFITMKVWKYLYKMNLRPFVTLYDIVE